MEDPCVNLQSVREENFLSLHPFHLVTSFV